MPNTAMKITSLSLSFLLMAGCSSEAPETCQSAQGKYVEILADKVPGIAYVKDYANQERNNATELAAINRNTLIKYKVNPLGGSCAKMQPSY